MWRVDDGRLELKIGFQGTDRKDSVVRVPDIKCPSTLLLISIRFAEAKGCVFITSRCGVKCDVLDTT